MQRSNSSAAVTGAALFWAVRLLAQEPQAPPAVGAANDNARFLAGLPPQATPALVERTRSASWQQHARFFETEWTGLEKNQLAKVRAWSKSHLPDGATPHGTVFYMFSGPDFLYANTFFPGGKTFVLCGMEPIGPLPNVSKLAEGELGGELRALQSSLDTLMNFSFFRTKSMKVDFQNHALSGTLPILYIFLARSGMTICDVDYVNLDAEGALSVQPTEGTRCDKTPAPGVRVKFLAQGSKTPRTVYYFSTDISDGGLKNSGFLKFCQTLAPGASCVKSASYLMHEGYFSAVRSFLLENSTTLVQDDSGIPCSFFTPETWEMRFFGSYPGPIPLFKNCYQPKLAEYYRTTKPEPLEFGIGYRYRAPESTLMVAARKSSGRNEPKAIAATPPAATPSAAASPTIMRRTASSPEVLPPGIMQRGTPAQPGAAQPAAASASPGNVPPATAPQVMPVRRGVPVQPARVVPEAGAVPPPPP